MSGRKRKNSKFSRNGLIILALLLLGIIVGVLIYNNRTKSQNIGKTSTGSYVDLSPATKQDQQANEDRKKNPGAGDTTDSNGQTSTSNDSSRKITVTPYATSVSSTQVKAFISGITEDGGTCSVKLVQGSKVVTGSSTGFANASYTSCEPIDLKLSSGSWVVTVGYSSSKASGNSSPQTFEIQ
jgi:hypothetical protein